MVNAGVEPNVHTYGALIDDCAKVGMVAKAFGAYGIMRSKNVKPDRVVFNALITACGQSGAVDRAFDVLAEMRAENIPVDPDHVTVGALIKACANAGQVEQAKEVYNMINKYNIKGTPELYTISVNSSSQTGDWEFACSVYNDMREKGVTADEMFISAFIDVAGHSNKLESAFEILQKAKSDGMQVGNVSYSSLMGACCNEAASLGIVPPVSLKESPIVVDVRNLQTHSAENLQVYLLTVLKSLKHRLAAGVKLPNIIILLPIDKIQVQFSKGDKMINLAGRTSRAVAALLRRLALPYIGNESFGKIRINGVIVKKWLQPKLTYPFSGRLLNFNSSQSAWVKISLFSSVTYELVIFPWSEESIYVRHSYTNADQEFFFRFGLATFIWI